MFLIFYIVVSAFVGYFAASKGRSFLGWMFLSMLISPILAGIFLVLSNDLSKKNKQSTEEENLGHDITELPVYTNITLDNLKSAFINNFKLFKSNLISPEDFSARKSKLINRFNDFASLEQDKILLVVAEIDELGVINQHELNEIKKIIFKNKSDDKINMPQLSKQEHTEQYIENKTKKTGPDRMGLVIVVSILAFIILLQYSVDYNSKPKTSSNKQAKSHPTPQMLMLVKRNVNIRSGPSTNDEIIGSLSANTTVNTGSSNGSWTMVHLPGGTGWVHSSFLEKSNKNKSVARNLQSTRTYATHPIDQMVIAFEGNYSRSVIKRRIDLVMGHYGLATTKENYSRAASSLVALRKETGSTEMNILNCMEHAYTPRSKAKFTTIAAICAAGLNSQ